MGFNGGGSGGLSSEQSALLSDMPDMYSSNALDIIAIQAAQTLESGQNANIVRDIFIDSNGYLNTIDTANTTAYYDSVNKIYGNGAAITATPTVSGTSTNTAANSRGFLATPSAAIKIVSITKHASCTAGTARIINHTTGTVVSGGQASFVGNVATFASPVELTASQAYRITAGTNLGAVGADGSNYTIIQANDISAQTFGQLVVNDMCSEGGTLNYGNGNIVSIIYTPVPEDKIVKTNAQTIEGASFFQVFAYKPTIIGTGSITAKVSFDNEAHYQDDLELDTPYAISNAGTQLVAQLKLNAGASNGAAACKGYGVMMW